MPSALETYSSLLWVSHLEMTRISEAAFVVCFKCGSQFHTSVLYKKKEVASGI
ncbi:hypothetical protein CDL12_03481 [Handroanthus impetiginosus]|uniref:Uncharacterized protein n=1 Tax=Handroanthus impetiginosus TaxID=429701 RepID=A0A2G9I201_9LAMI|nr:hypothetical protein CDL12_03481 [Handroanthus impetiginosus]